MSGHINRVPKDKQTDDIKLVASDADTYSSLYAVARSDGGKILTKSLARDVMGAVNTLSNSFESLSETALRAICAKLAANLALYKAITNAKDNLDAAQDELSSLLSESA
jgi:hypothetical protein